jgi:hypothetical protein
MIFSHCEPSTNDENNTATNTLIKEKQISFSQKNHSLDNNDNFSPDEKFLCYDTRGTVFNTNLANCKSIEKIEIATGTETILWKPESVTGKDAAPGVAAVSYHPKENKVIFIHGPLLNEIKERGYYGIRNRTGVEISADGKGLITKVDMRDVATNRPTTAGAQRGGTHRHEYSRNGKRIGFTYDDFLNRDYDRTIGYMEANEKAPEGYTHYFSLLVKPAKKGESKPGEIEKAHSDSWIDSAGTMRAFIGKVRAENGIDYENSLFVAKIPNNVDITTAFSGNGTEYPVPAKGISIRRLTHSTTDDGIVRGSYNGKRIAYLSEDKKGIKQVFVIPSNGSDKDKNIEKHPKQVTDYKSNASNIRWHSSDNWIFSISEGKIYASYIGNDGKFGKTILLTPDSLERGNLVVSPSGTTLAYNVKVADKDSKIVINGEILTEFDQIFILKLGEQFLIN